MSSREYFRRLEALFHELEALDDAARARRLAEIGAEDAGLTAELIGMLEPSPSLARDEQALDRVASDGGLAASLADDGDPASIGPYRLTRKLGQGGMGRVYLAEQSEPVQRQVALKLTRRGFDSAEAKARFKAERQALAVLEHPHIARVFDAGSTDDGRPWFAMEYIEGVPITDWAAARGLGLAERIRLLLPVCDAIQHAHRKGLIHRDLKPSNILVVEDGGRGFPKVIDFGIARAVDLSLDERSQVTQLGELVGTPEYMSPEQAALGAIDIDTRSDVYSLGLVLYELLVGQLPVTGKELRALGFEAMCRQIREGDTPRPSRYRGETPKDATTGRWRARLKGDLDSVLLKALAKDRERRYGSASELADDLKRYLDNQPVLAQPPSLVYRAGKFVRRHRWPVAFAGGLAMALLVGIATASYGLLQAREARDRAEASERQTALRRDIADAYADVLLRVFGASADLEATATALLDHQRSLDWDTDPDGAALSSYAVGRHFLSRNDYDRAREVFLDWLARDVGPDVLTRLGWGSLGYAHRYTGDMEQALAAFRTAASQYPDQDQDMPEYAAVMTQIAFFTGSEPEIDAAVRSLDRVLAAPQLAPAMRVVMLNSRFQLAARFAGPDEGYRAIVSVVEEIDRHPNMPLPGTDTNRLNLASYEIFHRNDPQAAERQLERVRQVTERAKGESRESAWRLELEAELARRRGDRDQAETLLAAALDQYGRFSGVLSESYRRTAAQRVRLLGESGRWSDAEAQVAALRRDGDDAWNNRWVVLAEADLALRREGPEAASRALAAGRFPSTLEGRPLTMRAFVAGLLSQGAELPSN